MTDQESRNLTVLSLRSNADKHFVDAQQFADTVESASSLFVRESAFNGLTFAAEQCREALVQLQTEFLSSDETLVEPEQLQAYSVYDSYCVQTEAKLVELTRKAAATTYYRRRRLAAISGIVFVCLIPIGWMVFASSHKVEPRTTAPIQSEKELVSSKYFQARSGDRLRALSGNSFDAYKGGLITAEAQSSGTVNDGGVAVVKEGAMVTALSGSTVYVYPGGTVVADAGSEIIAAQGAVIQKKDGAKVTFQQPAEWPNLVR